MKCRGQGHSEVRGRRNDWSCGHSIAASLSRRTIVRRMNPHVQQSLDAWEPSVAPDETADPIWQLKCYRVARCLIDHTAGDVVALMSTVDPKTVGQLSRAVGSIGANLAEGYSRRSAADRSRFYGYALGSTREATLWYRCVAPFLDRASLELRMGFLAQERMLLIGMLKSVQRGGGPAFEPG